MVTWTPHITVVDLVENRVAFSATRVDDATGESLTFSAGTGIVTTAAHKRAMEATVWAEYQAYLVKQSDVSDKVDAWDEEAKTNLEARE